MGVTPIEGGHATAPDVVVIFTNVLSNWGNGALMKKRNYCRTRCGQSCAGAIISLGYVELVEPLEQTVISDWGSRF